MKICHVCGAEFEDSIEICSVCGALLRDETLEEENDEGIIINNPTLLATLEDVVSAEILKDILKDNGIAFSCYNDGESGVMQVTFGGSFIAEEIYVDESDYEAAEKLYTEFSQSQEDFFFEDSDEEI